MIIQSVVLVMLAVNFVSAKPNHDGNQKLQNRIFGSYLQQRSTDSMTSDSNPDHPAMLLLPRSALPMDPALDKNKNRPLSQSSDRKVHQWTSSVASSSTTTNQTPSSSKTFPTKAQGKSKKRAKDTPSRESGNAQQHASNPSQQPKPGGQGRRPIETAQANIAREQGDERTPNRPTSPLSLSSAAEALAQDMTKLSFQRFSQLDTKAIESEHEAWLETARSNIEKARINARTKSMARIPNGPRPARIHHELKEARSAVKRTRDEAKTHITGARDALYSRPISSPTTRLKFARAGAAMDKAQGVASAYHDREYISSIAASGTSRWNDYIGHVKKAYKTSARTTALDAYYHGLLTEYQSKLDGNALSKMNPEDPQREQAVKLAVGSRKDFHAAAKIYYLRDQQYRDVRNKFVEGASSEDESHEFNAVPRNKPSS